jgi:hypothetical protein
MREICVYEEYYFTLSLGISNVMLRAFGNFRRALVPLCFDLDVDGRVVTLLSGLVYDRTQASIWHPCVGVWRTCNYKMWGQLTNRIGVFRHRSTALFEYANRKRGSRKFPDISYTSEFERGREDLTKPRERGHSLFSFRQGRT